MTDTAAAPAPLTRHEQASYVLAALALLATFYLHLVPALLAGFLTWTLLASTAQRLKGGRISHGLARMLAVALLGLLAASAVAAAVLLLYAFVRGKIGDLPAVVDKMAETLARLRESLASAGIPIALPEEGGSTAAVGVWLREHAGELRHAGTAGVRGLIHALFGAVAGVFVFFHAGPEPERPLAAALGARAERFGESFRSVVKAQAEISAVNSVLTAVFLYVVLPLAGYRLPLAGTLVGVTFLCGLVPVAGNLISNTVVVLVALGVSPWAAVWALAFLVLVHKLEYVLNARIVGGHIGASAWETLLAILVFEAAFGIAGVILAPVVYAWAKSELVARRLV